jgi:hypothetical protein
MLSLTELVATQEKLSSFGCLLAHVSERKIEAKNSLDEELKKKTDLQESLARKITEETSKNHAGINMHLKISERRFNTEILATQSKIVVNSFKLAIVTNELKRVRSKIKKYSTKLVQHNYSFQEMLSQCMNVCETGLFKIIRDYLY